jgi:hypothetical protein
MARQTKVQEGRQLFDEFFAEVKAGYMAQIMATRQKGRRAHLLNEMAVFDKVEGRAYDWFNARIAE